jgi:hypothetical protein
MPFEEGPKSVLGLMRRGPRQTVKRLEKRQRLDLDLESLPNGSSTPAAVREATLESSAMRGVC